LSATNEAIIRSDYRDEVLQGVTCCAQDGGFIGAAVLLADPDQSLIFTAGAGDGIEVMKGVKISTVENTSNGRGLAGVAFWTGWCPNRPRRSESSIRKEGRRHHWLSSLEVDKTKPGKGESSVRWSLLVRRQAVGALALERDCRQIVLGRPVPESRQRSNAKGMWGGLKVSSER
jgi:hypothetical protein